jgi:hypothetical protein
VTDDIGNLIRYPIRLSNFKEEPRFFIGLQAQLEMQANNQVFDKFHIAQWVRDLNKLVERSKNQDKTAKPKLKKKSRFRRL